MYCPPLYLASQTILFYYKICFRNCKRFLLFFTLSCRFLHNKHKILAKLSNKPAKIKVTKCAPAAHLRARAVCEALFTSPRGAHPRGAFLCNRNGVSYYTKKDAPLRYALSFCLFFLILLFDLIEFVEDNVVQYFDVGSLHAGRT